MKLINKQTIIAAFVGGVSALALTAGGVALAHGGPHGGGGPWDPGKMEEHLAELTERLDLSPAQEQQIRTIMEQAQAEAETIREMPRGKEKFVAMKELHFSAEDQVHANLSCEQREELRLLKREHKVERMQQHFERKHGSRESQK